MKAGDRKVYVIDGDVVQYTDKSGIDVAKSDKSIVVCDAETGKYEYTSPDQLMNVGEPADPSTLSEAYMANERAKEAAANGEGTAEGNAAAGSNAAANGDVSADGGKAEVVEPAYTDGSRVEINGHEYDVKSAGEKTVVLVDEHGKELAWTRSALDAKLESGDAEVLEPKAEAAPDVATEGLKAGDVFADSDGNALTVKRVDGDKVVAVGADGKEQTYEDGMFEQMVESGVLKRAQKTEEPSEAKVDLTDNQGYSTPQPDLSSESKGAEQSSGVQAEVPQVDVQENAPMPMRVVGKGKNAVQEEDWLATTPKRGHDYVFKESGLDAEEANAFVENKVAEAEKNLEKVKGKAPKMGTNIAAYKEAKADYEARVAEAQKAVDYWHAVKAERDKVLLEERRARKEKDKALYDDAVAQEKQRKAEMAQKAAEQEALGSNAVAPAIKEKWENAPKVDGGADEITLPNGEVVTGHYVLTESGAASASHQATNGFAETEGYPVDVNGETVNDRDYKRDAEAQQVTRGMAADYDSRALQSPVVVSGDGVVLSGNGRTMAGEIAALNGSDAKYNAYLRGHAGKFGFTTEQVEGFKHPRVVFVPDGEMPYTSETFAKFNQREQKSQSRTEMAVKLGKVVDDALFGRVMDVIGRHESLAEFYADDAATAAVVKELADAGVIPQTEMAQLFDGGRLSESGQAMVEGVLVGKVFQGSPDAVRQITEVKSMRKAVMAALPEVVACHRLGGGYDLSKELAAAVDLVYKARKAGFKLGQHVSQHARQGNLFQLDDGATVADYNNAAVMMLADVMNDGRVTQLKKVLSFYNTQAADSAQGIGDMFAGGVKSKGQIINEVNELLNNGQEYDRRTPSVADGQGVGGEGGEQGDVAGPSHQGGEGSERGLSEAFDGLAAQLKTAEGGERKRVLGEMRDGIARFAEENGYPVPEFLLTREDFLAAVPEKDRAKYVEMLEKGMRMPAYYENKKVYYFVEGCDNFDKDVAETLAHEYTHADNAEFPENVNAIVYAVEDTHEVSQDELVDILEKLSDSTVYEEKAEQLEAEGKNANPMLADEVIAHSVGRMVVEGEQALDGITKNPTLQFFIKRAYKERENERQHNLYSNRNAERADKTVPSSGRNSSDNEAVAGGTPGDGQLGGSSEGDGHLEGTAERGRSAVSDGKEVAAPSLEGAKVGVTDGEKSSATGDVVPSGEGDTPLLDVDGKPIVVKADDGKVELNLRTWQDEKQQVRDALLDGGLEPEAVDAMMAQAETIASGMSGLADKYPLFGAWQKVAATNRPILRNNAGGYLSFDYSFNCVKKDALNAVMEALVAEGKGGHLGVTQVEALKKVLQKHGFLTPCVMCYVEAKRKVYKQSKEMAAKWNAVAEAAGLTGEDMGAERELGAEQRNALAQLANGENLGSVKGSAENGKYGIKKDTIVKIAKLMLDSAKLRGRMNYEWMMSPSSYTEMYNKFGDTGLMEFMSQGQSRGKALLETSPFSFKSVPRDLMMGMYNPVVLANMGGVRQFSYEDARAVMFFDYYTQFLVMQGARAPEHLYTKRPFMPEMFGRTGAMMNQSLIVDIWRGEEWHKKALGLSDKEYDAWLTAHAGFVPRGALPKGHTLYEAGSTELVPNWGVESFPVDIAMKNVHNKDYKGTVGNVVVAPNRKFILWALDNPDIHMVLAYHANGANPLVKSLTGYDRAEAMDDGYHTHDENGKVVDELSVPEIGLEIHDSDLQWNVLLRRNGYDARKAAQVYLDYCKEHGLTPMFCYDGVVDMSGERATSHPEYYKLLTDFRVYDEDGNSIRQRAVKALLPENWQVILDKYLQQESALGSKVGHIGLDEGLMKEINAVTRFASIESGERDTLTKLLTSIYGKDNVQVLATREFDAALDEVTERGHAQMLRDNGGTVYGFAVGDRIVLNEDLFNANTPMHEHTHVYMKVLKATNPRLYNRGMELWRDTPLWKQAKRGLEELGEEPTDEQIFSECMSQFTGAENEKVISEVTGITDKNWLQKAMSWLSEMWKGVKSAFSRWTQNDLDGLTAEQFGRMPLRAVYDAKERKAYAKMVKQVFGNGGAGEHGVEMMHEPSREETILRDVVIEHMKGSGLDVIGTEEGQRVLDMANDDGAKEHRVYHGSGAEFDHFDHSHMSEGEGSQVYGWGTYVTEVKGIAEGYAIRARNGISNINEEWYLKRGELESNIYRAKEQLPFLKGEYKAEMEAQISEWEKQLKEYDGPNNLYTVEIPDDNGSNYLAWNEPLSVEDSGRIISGLFDLPPSDIEEMAKRDYTFKHILYDLIKINDKAQYVPVLAKGNVLSRSTMYDGGREINDFGGVYRRLQGWFGSAKAVSKFLYSLGYAGIKYPADYRSGGREDDAKNYVIFNENDAEITDHVRFFKTKNGEAYGFTVGGKIYYDPRIANAETPVHEYAHLWASALKANNAKEWKNVVDLMKGTNVWEEVKETYPELETDDEIADEVLATYSGRRGAERLREEMRKAAAEGDGVMGKAEAVSALQRVKRAIDKFWKAVADFLHIHYTSAEEVADRVMKDLLDGVDPRSMMDGGKSLRPETRVNVVEAEAGHGFKNYAEAKTWAKEHIARTYSGEETGGKGDIRISNAAVDKYLSQSAVDKSESKDVHLAVLKVLPDVIRESVDAEQHADFKKGKDGVRSAENGVNPNVTIHRLYGAVRMDGKVYRVKVTLKEDKTSKEPKVPHSYEATKIELFAGTLGNSDNSLSPNTNNSITAANLLNGVDKSYDGGKFFEDYNKIREQFIGEKGAAAADHADEVNTRLDNLSVAREMEAEKKDAKAIKLATGWERGADGKWRYEVGDVRFYDGLQLINRSVKTEATLNDLLEDNKDKEALFASYPSLKNMPVVLEDMGYKGVGEYNYRKETIRLNTYLLTDDDGYFTKPAVEILNHEIQHAIQKIEGFARGGSPAMVRSEIKKQMAEVTKQIRQLRAEGKEAEAKELIKKNKGLYEASVSDDDFGSYKSLAGEVESRNVESRMGMSAAERRASLAAETEDVSREDQIFLTSGDGGNANSEMLQETGTENDYSEFAKEHGVDADMVKDYALGIKTGNLQKANFALAEIRRTMRVANRGMKLSEFGKLFRPVQKELAERYGDIEVLRQEYIDAEMRERGVMEAARKRAEEEAAKRKARADELRLLPAEELDRRYFEAVERGDDAAAREMLDEAARRKGYGDTESEYQGVGAWVAPSNPGYETDEARRDAVGEDSPNLNVEDMAAGYSNQPEDIFVHPDKYSQGLSTSKESGKAIQTAIDDIRNGKKEVKIKVYRAVPTSVKESKLRNGDWVTPSKEYAEMHGNNRLEGKYRIIEDEVPAGELWWDGNDVNEWGFDDGKGYKYKNVENSRKLNDLVTRDDNGEIIAPSKRFDENVEDVRYRTSEELDQINQKFNERLDELVSNPNQKDKVLHLGRSSEFLKDGGVSDAEIVLDYDKLVRKSMEGYKHEHPFDISDVRDLPIAIAYPIAVFDNTNGKNDGKVILTELKKDGRNFIVAIQTANLNRKGGKVLEVNKIVTLFPKDARGVVNWFNTGKATNIDKKKALHFIEALLNHSETTITNEELLSAANVVKDFETLQLSASQKAKQQAANDLARQMHVEGEVEVVTSIDGLTGRQAKAKGWYDVRTGRVTIVLPNNKNAADVRETVFHEVVAHKGLRNLVGEENFNTFLDNVYNNAEEGIKQTIDEMAEKKYNGDKRKATEEYMAHLAEDGEYVKPENQGFFAKVRDFLTDLLRKVGIKLGFKLTDNDLRYILWRSWKGLAERDGGSVFEKAEDVKMQHELGQTDEARSASGENGIMFREGSDELKDVVEKMKADVERLHEGELNDLRSGARAIGGRLSELNKAMRLQRAYDMSTVASVTELAKTMLKNGLLSEMSDYDVRRLLSVVNNVHGKGDIRPYVQKVVDMMVGNRLRNVSKAFDKLLAMRGKKVDARGVEVQGELDLAGQRMADVVWKGIGMSDDDVADMCADAQDRMMSANGAEAAAAATDYAGWQIVMHLGLLPYYNNLLAEYLASYTNTLQLIDCQYFTQCKILQISLAHNLHTPHAATRHEHGRRILRHRGTEKSVAPTDFSTSLWRMIHRMRQNRLRGSGVGRVRCMQGCVRYFEIILHS